MIEGVFNLLKVTSVIAVATAFAFAITGLINLIAVIVFHSVIGEVFAIISACLPFDASLVFGAIGTAITGILSFMVSKKIFDLTSWSISSI